MLLLQLPIATSTATFRKTWIWKQGVEPIRPDDSKAIFFNSAVSKIPDIVGVTNLYPVECFDRPGFETLYCGMCAYWTTSSVMLDKHLVSYIHRMNYLSRNYATFYKIVKDEHDKAMKEKLLTQYVKQIWRNEGSGMMTHKLKCVLSASALSRLWPDYRKFHSDSWKKGVKVEIIHQAAQQEAYERTTAELAVIKEKERHREGDRERERRRSRSREPSHRHSSDRKDRVRDYYDRERGRDHDRHREKRSSRRSPSPHSRPKWSPPGYDEHRSRDSRGHGRYSPPPGGLSEEDQQLRMICSQLGIPDSDLPMARNIIREYSQNLRSNAPPPEPYRSSSPTSARLSSLRNILHQALAMETQQALPPQQFQVPPPTHQFVDSSPLQQIPPIQHQSTQDLWPHGSSIQPSWGVPPPNMNVPPPQPASATFPGFSQTLPDTYSYPPPSGHY
uniref:C2H2-type domain-containing protein n=1 Tax=Steinernema glaseri TaxID=37863 RepID=A0A1I7YQR4_9BILA